MPIVPQQDRTDHCVYAIACDADKDFLYIGRTLDPEKRYKTHMTHYTSAVYKYVQAIGAEHFYMIILKANLSYREALAYEAMYIYDNYFKFNLANRTLPSTNCIIDGVSSKEEAEHYLKLLLQIEQDQNTGHPRVHECGKVRKYWSAPTSTLIRYIQSEKK